MKDLEEYKQMGKNYFNKLKLLTYPIAVRLISQDEEVPSNIIQPKIMFDSEIPACITYTWCRRAGMSFFLKGEDIACKPASIKYFALEKTSDSDAVYNAWAKKARYKKNVEAEKKSREFDAVLNYGDYKGFVISPLNFSVIKPHLVMIYCSPLILSHLILAATYDGGNIVSNFNGMESSCKEAIIRTYITKKCQVIAPGMGDRVLAGVQDHEMIFSIPESELENTLNNLFLSGNRIKPSPFSIPHLNATLGPISLYGKSNEPAVWQYLRKKINE